MKITCRTIINRNLSFVVSEHQHINVYSIKLLDGKGHRCMVNCWQLLDLKKFHTSADSIYYTISVNLIYGPNNKSLEKNNPPNFHPCGTRLKTQVNAVTQDSSTEDGSELDLGIGSRMSSITAFPSLVCGS